MPVVAADLTSPTGELQPTWFADLPAALAVWITLGEAQAPAGATTEQADRVTTAYAYVRGFEDVLLRAAGDPNSVSIDKGDISLSFSKDQRDRFAAKVAKWEAELAAAIGAIGEVAPVVIDNPPRASYSQRIVRSF
jgi:hypothetical protein